MTVVLLGIELEVEVQVLFIVDGRIVLVMITTLS